VATVAWADEDAEFASELPLCEGPATASDLDRDQRNRRLKAEVGAIARALIADHELPMRVVGVDLDDRSSEYGRVVAVYYTAPQRVDFRALYVTWRRRSVHVSTCVRSAAVMPRASWGASARADASCAAARSSPTLSPSGCAS